MQGMILILKANKIFELLKAKVLSNEYDDEYLILLAEYYKSRTNKNNFYIFYAAYALAKSNYKVAMEYAVKAKTNRFINKLLWQILAKCYLQKHDYDNVAYLQGLLKAHYNENFNLNCNPENIDTLLNNASLGMGIGLYAPIAANRVFYANDKFFIKQSLFWAEFLPNLCNFNEEKYYVGVKLGKKLYDYGAQYVIDKMKNDVKFTDGSNADIIFDLVKAKKVKKIIVNDGAAIVPIATTVPEQALEMSDAHRMSTIEIQGRNNFEFYRFNNTTTIKSHKDFIVGKTIKLGHSTNRKKVVLNILLDAFCWERIKEKKYEQIPNIMSFFKQGIIFDNHYSVSEYTFPSLATIETGLYPATNQIFNEKVCVRLSDSVKTVSEQMNNLGYYCVNIMGDGCGIYNGATRGYDRIMVAPYALEASKGISYTIEHLSAFSECDQFLFLHIDDTHPWPAVCYQAPLATQTKLDWYDRIPRQGAKEVSVHLKGGIPYYTDAVDRHIEYVDSNLKMLFDYITSHYDDNEYIVQLYSDHGTGIYDTAEHYILGEYQTHAALMMRGSNIPALGIVEDEYTSSVDMYAIMQHHTGFADGHTHEGNLPRALGGGKRDYVASYIIFPGQKFNLCIRMDEYKFCVESVEPLLYDGTVDLRNVQCKVFKGRGKYIADPPAKLKKAFEKIFAELVKNINNSGDVWDKKA